MQRPIYLVEARKRRRLTQQKLAILAKVQQATISKMERNPRARPSFETRSNVARALRVDPARLRCGPPPAEMRA